MSDQQKSETSVTPAAARRDYAPPVVEPLGSWRAVTLQEITFNGYLEDGRKLDPGSYA
jgi:hypothetical protein